MPSFTPTPEQEAIVEAARDGTDNLLITAYAGAAKTSTLVLIANALKRTAILSLAFNKKIAVEMQERLPSMCVSSTLNSFGHRAWAKHLNKSRLYVRESKLYDLLVQWFEEARQDKRFSKADLDDSRSGSFGFILKSLRLGKTAGFVPRSGNNDLPRGLVDEDEFLAFLEEDPSDIEWAAIREVTATSIREGLNGYIDFDDQILLPTIFGVRFPQYPLVMVDEAQDLSPINHAMLALIARKRLIAVGDSCQPAGTKVAVVRKKGDRWNAPKLVEVPIEQLTGHETLLSYNKQGAFLFNAKQAKPPKKDLFTGLLVTVTQGKRKSRYTDSHWCYASFASFRDKYALYLMRKGDRFRVGRCKMFYPAMGAGVSARAAAEKADAYWILRVFDTEREAALEEAVIQAQFGLPDITFKCPGQNTSFAQQDFLDAAWQLIETAVNLRIRARACLDFYGQMIEYPLWEAKNKAAFSPLRPSLVRASNLLPGCLMLPYEGGSKTSADRWQPVDVTKQMVVDFPVYSLEVEGTGLYVADSIVTHNCQAIYGFRGADESSMSNLQQMWNMREMRLTISFRCPKAVVREAQWRAPDMKYPDWAIEGEVRTLKTWSPTDLTDRSVIICRNNAPLFSMALKFMEMGVPVELVGRDLHKQLLKILEGFRGGGDEDAAYVFEQINRWEAARMRKVRAAQMVRDQAACLRALASNGRTLDEIIARAEMMFNRSAPVKLMTGHKAKGLEFDDVFFLDPQLIDINQGQEANLKYVIQTRAKRRLTYVTSEGLTTTSTSFKT